MDVSTYPDLDITGRDLTEDESIVECLRRGLSQPPGTLSYSPSDGFDLRALLSRATDLRSLYVIDGAIEAQALRDERVAKASFTVAWEANGEVLRARGLLVKRDGAELRLTVEASKLTVTLLRS